jgi:hypothetical protein
MMPDAFPSVKASHVSTRAALGAAPLWNREVSSWISRQPFGTHAIRRQEAGAEPIDDR